MTVLPNINTVGVFSKGEESFLQVSSGEMISVQNPSPSQIHFSDIINSLTKQCRFNGHCRRFYSVAEHTVRGVYLAEKLFPENKNLAKSFFLHDFTEAYVGDVIRPVKKHLKSFQKIEKKFHKAICKAFSFKEKNFDEDGVHLIDNYMAMWEKRDLLHVDIVWPGMPSIDHLDLPKLTEMSLEELVETMLVLKERLDFD